jgi:flavorubredoxin
MNKPYKVTDGIHVLPSHLEIPMMGFLPVNAFVINSKEPVLIDSCTVSESDGFMEALESVIDPKDLKWIWLTHDDADHTGSIFRILEAAPNARLVANALAVLRLNTVSPVPMDRVLWLNPGQSLDVGDRKLYAVRPPLFDNPTAIGLMDDSTGTFFSVDCFGGILPVQAENADEVPTDALAQGMSVWATADSPWIHAIDRGIFGRNIEQVRNMDPKIILSSHLPSAVGRTGRFLDLLAQVPDAQPFIAPGQEMLDQILAQMKGGA